MPQAHEAGLPVLAVDIGGTKILVALFSAQGEMLDGCRCPTQAEDGVPAAVERLAGVAEDLLVRNSITAADISAVGIAAAGAIDTRQGLITVSPNLPGWRDVPLGELLRRRLGMTSFMINDASAAALGEHRFGAARGAENAVLLTLGTGIGGGVIINGELFMGATGGAGEIGHMVIDINGPECPCGSRGCLEQLTSGTAIAREARSLLGKGSLSILTEMSGGNLETVTGEMVAKAAHQGDDLSAGVFAQAAGYLGVGLANILNIFNPDVIVLGGGMSTEEELFIEPARRVAMEKAFPLASGAARIVTAELGNKSGIYGAAAYAFDRLREQA